MPESASHIRLVKALCKWIADEHLSGDQGCVLSDTAGNGSYERTPVINGYVPDAFVGATAAMKVIVGEAKTSGDLESKHSMAQIEAFMRFCNDANGTLVIAVPWHHVAFMKNTLVILGQRKGLDVLCCQVIDCLPD